MGQSDQFFFSGVVLSNDLDRMPRHLLLLHECAHVLWHVAFANKECALLEVDSFFGCNVPHHLATK